MQKTNTRKIGFVFKFLAVFLLLLFFIDSQNLSAEEIIRLEQKQHNPQFKNPGPGSMKPVKLIKNPNQPDKLKIQLKSRTFTPPEDIAITIQSHIRTSPHERVHVFLQFHNTPDNQQKGILKNAKINLLNYIPYNSWLASVPRGIMPAQFKNSNVRWIGRILAEDKIFPPLLSGEIAPWAINQDGSVNLEVSIFKDVSLEQAKITLMELGAQIKHESISAHQLTVTIFPDKLQDIAQEDIVRWIIDERPAKKALNDGSRLNVGADIVQNAPYNLSGLDVDSGIWDGGDVDSTHDDFGSRVIIVDSAGVDTHATHVAGTLGGDGTLSSSKGGAAFQWKGMAPEVDIVSYLWDNNIGDHLGAITTYGIELSQNSWGYNLIGPPAYPQYYGYYGFDAPEYDDIVTGLYGKRISVVFAAGNDRDNVAGDYDTIGPPSTGKNMLCVGAIHSDDNSMTIFSGWGPMDDGRIKPDLVAPGDEVGGDGGIKSTFPADNYGVYYGTSMAAPCVSGCVSLIIQDYRNLSSGQDPLPSTIKGLLIHGAQDLGSTGPDYSFGYGGIQIKDSIDKLRTQSIVEDDVSHNITDTYSLYVPEGTMAVKITLVWDDPAATEGAAFALINDLDLIVTDPNNVRYYPWTLDPANPAAPAVQTQEDHTNNVEQVTVSSSITPGNWTIEIYGYNIPSAPQKYSLVFTPNYENNLIGKIYQDAGYSQEEKFFDSTDPVYIEAYVVSDGSPLTGADVTADLKLSNGSTVTTLSLLDQGNGYYRASWDSSGQAPDVYLADINVAGPILNTQKHFHLYPQTGVSAYRLDYNNDGNDDYVLENKHLIAVYDGKTPPDNSLLYLYQKDASNSFNFTGILDNDTNGRAEITTDNLSGINFHSFSFIEGENSSSGVVTLKSELTKAIPGGQSCMLDDDDLGTNNSAKGCRISADFSPITQGTLEFWARCRSQIDKDSFDIMLKNSSGLAGLDIYFLSGSIGYYNGVQNTIMAYNPDQWYHFKIIFDCITDKMSVYIDDMTNPKTVNVNFWNALANISKIDMDTGLWISGSPNQDHFDALCYVDDLDIYSGPTHYFTEDFEDDTAGSNPGSPWNVVEDSINTNVEIINTVYHEQTTTTSFDISIDMRTEEADYLVYKLTGFDLNIDDISTIFSPISGCLGVSSEDDRYHIGNGTDALTNTLTPNNWTNFETLGEQEKYVAIYDNSLTADSVDNLLISWVYFPNPLTTSLQDVGCWYEAGAEALRIRYDTTSALPTNEAEYILAFTQGSYSVIEQWMSEVAGGNYPVPNFMTAPFVLNVSVNPNAWPVGIVAFNEITQSTEESAITVTNSGSVNETFTLNITFSAPTWLPDVTAGSETYVLRGLFCGSSDSPTASLFKNDDIILSGVPVVADENKFGDPSLSKNGTNIIPGDTVDLWFQFQAPISTSDTSEQAIIVTVGAEQAL
ncbi:MAG: S8 family serine peptidase [Candidatus Omnitrophota bacterium]